MIDSILEMARQLRAEVPPDVALSDVEVLRSHAARHLEKAADLLGAMRAEETRAPGEQAYWDARQPWPPAHD